MTIRKLRKFCKKNTRRKRNVEYIAVRYIETSAITFRFHRENSLNKQNERIRSFSFLSHDINNSNGKMLVSAIVLSTGLNYIRCCDDGKKKASQVDVQNCIENRKEKRGNNTKDKRYSLSSQNKQNRNLVKFPIHPFSLPFPKLTNNHTLLSLYRSFLSQQIVQLFHPIITFIYITNRSSQNTVKRINTFFCKSTHAFVLLLSNISILRSKRQLQFPLFRKPFRRPLSLSRRVWLSQNTNIDKERQLSLYIQLLLTVLYEDVSECYAKASSRIELRHFSSVIAISFEFRKKKNTFKLINNYEYRAKSNMLIDIYQLISEIYIAFKQKFIKKNTFAFNIILHIEFSVISHALNNTKYITTCNRRCTRKFRTTKHIYTCTRTQTQRQCQCFPAHVAQVYIYFFLFGLRTHVLLIKRASLCICAHACEIFV